MSIRPPSPTPVWWKATVTKTVVSTTTTMVKAKLAFDARRAAAAKLGVHPEDVELSEPTEDDVKKEEGK